MSSSSRSDGRKVFRTCWKSWELYRSLLLLNKTFRIPSKQTVQAPSELRWLCSYMDHPASPWLLTSTVRRDVICPIEVWWCGARSMAPGILCWDLYDFFQLLAWWYAWQGLLKIAEDPSFHTLMLGLVKTRTRKHIVLLGMCCATMQLHVKCIVPL